MQELLIAAFVGLSLGNSWLCLFLAFGMSTVELRTGMYFLAGRTVGLIVLGLIIIFAGMFLEISPKLMQGVAGILAVAFGLILVVQHSKKKQDERSGRKEFSELYSRSQNPKINDSLASGTTRGFHIGRTKTKNERGKANAIEVMNNGGGCEHPGQHKRDDCKKHEKRMKGEMCELKNDIREIDGSGKNRQAFGFGVGLLRGVTPCFKIVVLAPLMVAISVGDAVLMLLVFVGVSMVYPVIGYLSANTMHNLIHNRKLMLMIGGIILIIIGLYYIYESLATYGAHVPGA